MHVYGPDMHVSGIVPLALIPGKTTNIKEFSEQNGLLQNNREKAKKDEGNFSLGCIDIEINVINFQGKI